MAFRRVSNVETFFCDIFNYDLAYSLTWTLGVERGNMDQCHPFEVSIFFLSFFVLVFGHFFMMKEKVRFRQARRGNLAITHLSDNNNVQVRHKCKDVPHISHRGSGLAKLWIVWPTVTLRAVAFSVSRDSLKTDSLTRASSSCALVWCITRIEARFYFGRRGVSGLRKKEPNLMESSSLGNDSRNKSDVVRGRYTAWSWILTKRKSISIIRRK